ncbi:MAG: hypothetical protein CMQ43_09300 [Gammaproteobacteria bacterium]|nr:hypothetical protein [Gammaproteobacteria bacterium]MBK81092.1 hypothetical protein [Gammaproteobacteria bacterium]|tara:strand:+ start:11800 stop:13254 length:1455 start_codon:yes stop_codon:yes gene_type:complete
MSSRNPTLILPVENQVRELDAKLLMACVAAERGFDVTLGSRTYVHFALPFIPRGVFVAKSLRSISTLMFRLLSNLGHDIVAWDEESLVRFSSSEYYGFRYSPETFAAVDRLFAWGEDDAELFRGYEGYTGVPIHVTGNPRMDMLRPELTGFFDDDVRTLRARFGRFILVNTNFPFVNPFVPELALLQPAADRDGVRVGRTGRGMSLEFARGYAAHIETICRHFQLLIPKLADWFPEHTIIVRPHPSEDHDTWRRLVSHQPNVEVLHEGNVVPWLLAAEALLHNGCTTAVEAAVLRKPALSYMPVTSESFDYPLPNSLSHQAATEDEVRAKLSAMVEGRLGEIDARIRERVFAHHLASTDGPLAVEHVVDTLLDAGYADRTPPRPPLHKLALGWFGTNLRTAVKLFNMRRPNHRNSAAYHAHRFPEISAADLEARIERFRRLLGRFQEVRVERRSRFVFRVTRPQPQALASRAASIDGTGLEAKP